MATTQELETIFEIESVPTRNWYGAQPAIKLWEPNRERYLAINYARALEVATRQDLELEEAKRTVEIAKQRGFIEDIISFTQKFAGAGLRKRVERLETVTALISPIEATIEASRYILDIGENWDEEGSPGYAEVTWRRATQFVRDITIQFVTKHKTRIDPPKITPGPEGSIDVRWKADKRTLLVNFPANENEPADFFGSDKEQDTVKGTLDLTSQNQWLLIWLTR